jgi:hypothetical protein
MYLPSVLALPASTRSMSRSQSVNDRRSVSAPSASAWTKIANARPERWRGYGHPFSSIAFALAGSLPRVVVGSGFPPSAQTRRSIMSFSTLGA